MVSRAERAMSFGQVAGDYDRLRPGPPDEAADWLVPPGCRVAVDLGAGTGLLTRKLASRAERVIAIEPDDRMSAILRSQSPGAEIFHGTGEAIPLPDASADGLFVSSAWHWMDPDRTVLEIRRVLRDGGRFGVVWSSRDRDPDWLRDISLPGSLLGPRADTPDQNAAPGPDGEPAGRAGPSWEDPRWPRNAVTLPGEGLFEHVETAAFTFIRPMTVENTVALLGTYSRVIKASPADRAIALARAETAIRERFPGADTIKVPMRAWCWRADRTARA
jgi:SAM-dependent methyltransferase